MFSQGVWSFIKTTKTQVVSHNPLEGMWQLSGHWEKASVNNAANRPLRKKQLDQNTAWDKCPNLRQMTHLELCPYVKRGVDPAVVVKNLARHPTRWLKKKLWY